MCSSDLYPGTQLYSEMTAQKRMTTGNWDLYDTRHVVYQPQGISPQALKVGYDWSYREFYRWGNIFKAARAHRSSKHSLKHLAYSAGWKKFEPAWDFVIRLKQLSQMRPMLEAVLAPVAGKTPVSSERYGGQALEKGGHEVQSSVPESV